MGSLKEHCEHTKKRLEVTGEDIHKWIDAPVYTEGMNHRNYRHGGTGGFNQKEDMRTAIAQFKDKYPEDLICRIWVDHMMLDFGLKESDIIETSKQVPKITGEGNDAIYDCDYHEEPDPKGEQVYIPDANPKMWGFTGNLLLDGELPQFRDKIAQLRKEWKILIQYQTDESDDMYASFGYKVLMRITFDDGIDIRIILGTNESVQS